MVDSANCVQVFERVFNKIPTYVQESNIPNVGSVQNTMEELVSVCEEKACYVAVTPSGHRFI